MKKLLSIGIITLLSTSLLVGCFGGDSSAKFKDGSYTVQESAGSYGWKEFVTITVADGKISKTVFDSKNDAGDLKSADTEYNQKMKDASGVSAADAYTQLSAQFDKSGDIEGVKKVAGATDSSDSFVAMVKLLLPKLESGDTAQITYDAPAE